MVPKSAEALGAFSFWAEALTSWDRRRLCVLEFGPCCTWQALERLDASTDWGCGGYLLLNGILKGFEHTWSPAERARCFVTERESTGLMEFIAMEYWFMHFGSSCANLRLELDTDNRRSKQHILPLPG